MHDHRTALFLRMAEILRSHAPFLGAATERVELERKWFEISGPVQVECDAIKDEERAGG